MLSNIHNLVEKRNALGMGQMNVSLYQPALVVMEDVIFLCNEHLEAAFARKTWWIHSNAFDDVSYR